MLRPERGHTRGVSERREYGPQPAVLALQVVAALALIAVAVLSGDLGGRLLGGAAGLLLVAVAVHDLVLRPVLVVEGDGIVVATVGGRRRLVWSQVERIDASTDIRRGVRSRLLEIDAGGTLVLLSQRRLGREPADVVEEIAAVRGGDVSSSAPPS